MVLFILSFLCFLCHNVEEMRGVYLGLGTNLGDREENLAQALSLISQNIGAVVKKSTVIETEPWGHLDQPDFLNMVIEVETDLQPMELLSQCKDIEKTLGRRESGRWAARIIDVDILLYGEVKMNTETLTIPHKFMFERDFVMIPLKEIKPDICH